MKPPSYSIRKRLLLWISTPILIASFLIMLLAFFFSAQEIEEVYDAQLVHTAKTLLQFTEGDLRSAHQKSPSYGEEIAAIEHKYERKTAFRIWRGDDLLIQSIEAKEFTGLEVPAGFSDQMVDGKSWRFFVLLSPSDRLRVETAERYDIRYELVTQLMLSLGIPMTILIPSLLAIVWVGIRKSLKPLVILSQTVDTRDTDDLNPIDRSDIPHEAGPLVQALNGLFIRISESFRREREFTDHAAHELRTPLAAMKTQTQVLMKKAVAVPGCQDGLDNLNSTIDRTTHLLEQLLSLARLQNEKFPLSQINLSECVEEAVSAIQDKIKEKAQSLSISLAPNILIKGHADSLYILIRNLLDNAVKYTPAGGGIMVQLGTDAILTISDTGPGISDEDKKRVFNRFVRVDKSGQTGSGLGLSIVQWIAEAQDIILSLKDNTPKGLSVELKFKS